MFPFPFSFLATTASGLADIDNLYSMEFDGVNDYFDLGTDSSLDIFGGDFSVSLWFNHSNTGNIGGKPFLEIAAFTNKMAMTLGFTTNTGVGFAVGSTWNFNAGSGYNDGNWHHMVATRTGTTYKIYVDNIELSFSTGSFGYNTSEPKNRIGSGKFGETYYNGKLDEVAIFDYVLDSDQIEEIYDATTTGKTADLNSMATPPVAWYRMGD
jgi:hypothetical protein